MRYKFSEADETVSKVNFDTQTHGEFMGMEQNGEMKKLPLPVLKEAIDGIVDPVKGEGWSDENLVDLNERVEALEGDGEGSVSERIAEITDPIKGEGWEDENLVDHETRLSGLDTLEYEGKLYRVSNSIQNGFLVTHYKEIEE